MHSNQFCLWLLTALAMHLFFAPVTAADAPKLDKEITQDDNLKLDWVNHLVLFGDNLFVTAHRDGNINCFKQDPKTGAITFLKALDLNEQLKKPTTHLDAFPVLTDKNILYVSGAWTHAHGDKDSTGLSWYQYDPKDGSTKLLGTVPCPAGKLMLAPNGKMLYLGHFFANAITPINLDPNDGKPALGEKIEGQGLGANFIIAPDKKHLYAVAGMAVGWATIQDDGKLVYGSSVDLAVLKTDPSLRRNALAITPDGQHVYVAVWGYKGNGLGVFKPDAKTGALEFVKALAADKGMVGISSMVFTTDGKIGYYSGGPECSGSGLGFFTRDPATGDLTFGAKAAKSNPADQMLYAPESGTIYLSGFWSTKSFKIYSTK